MLFVVMLGVFLPIITLIIGAMWGRTYERSLWQARLLQRSLRPEEQSDRLTDALDVARSSADNPERLAQAVEAIAEEVERIAEGQRFLTRLLADREAPGAGKAAPIAGPVPSTPPAR